MKTIRLILEYDGTDYVGWQRQANGLSVQETVETALGVVLGSEIRTVSSGRTDAGVHARGMVVHFRTERDLPLKAYRDGVNARLPSNVAVREAAEAPPEFHARFSARGKWYRYTLHLAPVRSPLFARTSWHLRSPLDLETMCAAASAFVGRHDFSAFRSAGCDARTTEREIFRLDFLREGENLHVDIRGSGFLRNMVRIMVGTLVEVGLGRRPQEDIPRLLQEGRRATAGRTAPPQGLCLMEVWY